MRGAIRRPNDEATTEATTAPPGIDATTTEPPAVSPTAVVRPTIAVTGRSSAPLASTGALLLVVGAGLATVAVWLRGTGKRRTT